MGVPRAALADAGIAHIEVADLTGAPEMLGGRVKTLHPAVHGGILADRDKPEHLDALDRLGIGLIDLVVCNLYPFPTDPSVELIDVGGPTMVRAAAKNHDHVGVVVSPDDYPGVLAELGEHGTLSEATRRRLARDAFAHTAGYDAAIVEWLDEREIPSLGSVRGRPVGLTAAASPHHPPHPRARRVVAIRGESSSTRRPLPHRRASTRGGRTWSSTAARSSRTSTSSTPMRRGDWSTSSPPPVARNGRWPSSSTPTRAAPLSTPTWSSPTSGHWRATRPPHSGGSWPSVERSPRRWPRRSPPGPRPM